MLYTLFNVIHINLRINGYVYVYIYIYIYIYIYMCVCVSLFSDELNCMDIILK